jgi:hypothetical protein
MNHSKQPNVLDALGKIETLDFYNRGQQTRNDFRVFAIGCFHRSLELLVERVHAFNRCSVFRSAGVTFPTRVPKLLPVVRASAHFLNCSHISSVVVEEYDASESEGDLPNPARACGKNQPHNVAAIP